MSYNQPPPQGGYGPPQQQWGPPQGAPPGNWQQPPPGQWGPPQGPPPGHQFQQQGPPHQQWNPPPGPPPGQQQQWNAPPGPPPGQHQQWAPPPGPPPGQQQNQQWNAPGQQQNQQYGAPQGPPPNFQQGPGQGQMAAGGAPDPPSLGYTPGMIAQGWNAEPDAKALRSAMKGFGTDEKTLIRVLAPLDPLQAVTLRQTYAKVNPGRDLQKDIESETSRYFKEALVAIIRGPLLTDAHSVHDAVDGAGTNEELLNHAVLGRSNADLRAIKAIYQSQFKRKMEDDIDGDLSMKTKDLFRIVLRAERAENSAPAVSHQVERDVSELHRALTSRGEQLAICNVLALRSDGQIRAISQAYAQQHRKPLRDVVKDKISDHMQTALLLMLDRATDPIMSDAVQLEAAMAGMGTKDKLLVHRVITVHWNREHKDQVKRAYQHRYKKDLIERIRGETSGDYRALLLACMQ